MIYSLYHWYTDTHMDENGIPWYIDVAGGVFDMLVIVLVLSVAAGAPAAAADNSTLNETAPYYNDSTTVGNQSDWLPTNVTLDSLGELTGRIGPYFIGTGQPIPGGTTYAGTIVTGLVMVAIILGSVTLTALGPAGGTVVASIAGYGLTELGFAPEWMKIVILFIIGSIAAVAVLRTTS